MARFVYEFRIFQRYSFRQDVIVVFWAVIAAVAASFLAFMFLRYMGFVSSGSYADNPGLLHGAALERAIYEPIFVKEKDVVITIDEKAAQFGSTGQENVEFLSLLLSSKKDAAVKRLVFSSGGYAKLNDLVNLQLYVDDEFYGEKAFFNGKAAFDDINIKLESGKDTIIKVTGKISEDASSGNRIQIGFSGEEDFVIKSGALENLSVNLKFPAFGPAVSVVGWKL